MTIVRLEQLVEVENLSIEMGLSYSVKPFQFDGIDYAEIKSSSEPLLFLINKKITSDEERKIFNGI